MEFHGTRSAPISMTWAVPWNSMEFHGTRSAPISMTRAVPWNYMEFHGTLGAPISMTRAVPWNSMELRVRQFCWHEQFLYFYCGCGCPSFRRSWDMVKHRPVGNKCGKKLLAVTLTLISIFVLHLTYKKYSWPYYYDYMLKNIFCNTCFYVFAPPN